MNTKGPHKIYHIDSVIGGWYETLMRPFVFLYGLWDDMGTDSAGLLFASGSGSNIHDNRIHSVLL